MITSGPVVALVVAAGSGVRMGSSVPKVLLDLGGTPVLVHALRALLGGGVDRAVVLSRVEDAGAMDRAIASGGIPADRVRTATGGARRQDSVARGLVLLAAEPELSGASVVLIHDAARPLVPAAVVARVIAEVRAGAAAVIPTVPVSDTVRRLDETGTGSHLVDRSRLAAVQTPQGFDPEVIRRAHDELAARGLAVTDDAAACELIGVEPLLVPGSRESLKITEPIDLMLAGSVLSARTGTRDVATGTTR